MTIRRLAPLCLCLSLLAIQASTPPAAETAATSRSADEDGEVTVGGGRVLVPGSLRAATRRLPGGPVAVLLFSDPSVEKAWARAASAGGEEILVEIFPRSDGLGVDESARAFEDDLRAVGWRNVARAAQSGRTVLTASAGDRVRGHVLTPTLHIRVTAAKRSAAFERAVSGSGDAA